MDERDWDFLSIFDNSDHPHDSDGKIPDRIGMVATALTVALILVAMGAIVYSLMH